MKILGRFVLCFAAVFVLTVWPWPGVQTAMREGFRAETRWLVHALYPREPVRVEAFSDSRYPYVDTVVILPDRKGVDPTGANSVVVTPFDTTSQFWIPFAMLFALIGATPIPWSKCWRGLWVGTLAIQLLVTAVTWVSVAADVATADPAAGAIRPLTFAHRLLVENIWFSFVPPFLFWAVWLAWGGHWRLLWQRLAPAGKTT
jgi:hypothetical protein